MNITSQKAKRRAEEDLQEAWKVVCMKETRRSLLAEIFEEYFIFIMVFSQHYEVIES